MKKFFTHPVTIIVGIIASAGIIYWIGYNYWGWYGGSDAWKISQLNKSNNVVGRIGNINSCPSGTFTNPETGLCMDWSKLPRTKATQQEISKIIEGARTSGGTISEMITTNDNQKYAVTCINTFLSCCRAFNIETGWYGDVFCGLYKKTQPIINPIVFPNIPTHINPPPPPPKPIQVA